MSLESKESKILILALGNPNKAFARTYHNAGVLALATFIESLTGEKPETLDWKSHKKLFAYAAVRNIVFMRSLTFMNESGIAAAEAVKKFCVAPERLVILHDDSDIPLGSFKISSGRSSGGHHGAQSIIDHLGTKAFLRVRIGIRPAREASRKKAGDFVLARITPSAGKKLELVFRKASEALAKSIQYPEIRIQ
jgi:PTH1 family peptidyl-tRNA hydrolase